MIKILIVDDDLNKVKKIKEVIASFPEISSEEVFSASDLFAAKKFLLENQFDLLILDLFLPQRFGDEPDEDGGIKFLNEINLSGQMKTPFHIIGLTSYKDLKEKFKNKFEDYLWFVITYEESYNNWSESLNRKINYLLKSKRELISPSNLKYNFDVAIITALNNPELQQILDLECNWKEYKIPNDYSQYFIGYLLREDGKKLKLVSACADQMGMTACTNMCDKLIYNFRPKFLVMGGIAAGVNDDFGYGDILIAEQTWDYGSGKISDHPRKRIFQPDSRQIQLNPELKVMFDSLINQREYLNKIQDSWKFQKAKTSLNAHLGPLASGSYVIGDENMIKEIKSTQRKLIGVDMETYALFFSATHSSNPKPTPFSIKSVSDFANSAKNDNYRQYASYTSARYIYEILKSDIEF